MISSDKLDGKCSIKSCRSNYKKDESSCRCLVERTENCRRKCYNTQIFNKQCRCFRPKICPITSCIGKAIFNKNKCICEVPEPYDYCDLQCDEDEEFKAPCQCVPKNSCEIISCQYPALFIENECKCTYASPQDYCTKTCADTEEFEFPCQCVPKSLFVTGN